MYTTANFRAELARRRMNMLDLSKASGIYYGTITKILAGQVDPRAGTLDRLAKALGVPTTIFFDGDLHDKANA